MTTLDKYNFIITNKEFFIKQKDFESACKWREKEVDFMMENFGIDVRSQFIKNLENNLTTNIIGIVKSIN